MIKIVNWVQGLRADLPDMLSGIPRTNYERLASRTIDNEDNPIVDGPHGGHVIKGFGVDMFTGTIAAVSFAAGVFTDKYGLPISLGAFSLDLTALGGTTEAAIWARWSLVGADAANRKRLVAGVKTTIVHNTRQDVTVITDATGAYGTPPDAVNAWTLIGRLLSSGGTLSQYAGPATIVWRPNAAWESAMLAADFDREVKVSAITAAEDAEGDALYPLVEKLRKVIGVLRGGVASAWDTAPARNVELLSVNYDAQQLVIGVNMASITSLSRERRWARALVALAAGPVPALVASSGFAAPTVIAAGCIRWDFTIPTGNMIAGIPNVTLTIRNDPLNPAANHCTVLVSAHYYNGAGDCTGLEILTVDHVAAGLAHAAYIIDVRP